MGSKLKINWYTTSFAIDQLVRCLSYQRPNGCSMCPECLGYHAIPSFPHGIHSLLQNISDLLVRCFCLAIGLGMVLHPGGFTLNSLRPFLLVLSCEVWAFTTRYDSWKFKARNVISWTIFFEFFESAATQEVCHPFGQIVHGLQDVLALT